MKRVLAVGVFDGVHLGHQAILRGADLAVSFSNHPLEVLRPEVAPRLIVCLAERERRIRELGVGEVKTLEFTPRLAGTDPAGFLAELRRLAATDDIAVRCGANWRFGRGGAGDAQFLRRAGVSVAVVPAAEYRGVAISSTRIRTALAAGEIGEANAMLGRRYALAVTVVRGKGLGSRFGFPTVNCRVAAAGLVRLPFGVYEVAVAGFKGAANFGLAPTLGADAWCEPTLEIHFAAPPPAAEALTVEFVRYVRPERRFGSLAELQSQIAADCDNIFA